MASIVFKTKYSRFLNVSLLLIVDVVREIGQVYVPGHTVSAGDAVANISDIAFGFLIGLKLVKSEKISLIRTKKNCLEFFKKSFYQ